MLTFWLKQRREWSATTVTVLERRVIEGWDLSDEEAEEAETFNDTTHETKDESGEGNGEPIIAQDGNSSIGT